MADNPFLRAYENPSSLEEYKKALNIFYNPSAKCPGCSSKTIDERGSEGNTLKMSCKFCKWKMEIVIPKIVNLYVEHSDSKFGRVSAIYGMLFAAQQDNRDMFNTDKKDFDAATKLLKDVEALIDKQEEEAKKIKEEYYDKYNKLLDIYYKRKELYPTLNREGVKSETVRSLYQVVKNEGYPISETRVKGVGKQYDLPEETLKPWLEWVNYVIEYEKLNKEVKERSDQLIKFEDRLQKFNRSIMIEDPKVIGSLKKK